MSTPPDLPAHDALADLLDADDWDRAALGSMADFASEDSPATDVHEGHCVRFAMTAGDMGEEVGDATHDSPPA